MLSSYLAKQNNNMFDFGNLLCKIGWHSWRDIFIGCPINYNGLVIGKSCQECKLLKKDYYSSWYLKRPKTIPMNVHVIQAKIPIRNMSNLEKQFYLRNLNNKDTSK